MITVDALWLLANIGREIKLKRKKLKLTQSQLANLLDVKYQQIQRWERNGYQSCSLNTLIEVLKSLHCEEMKQLLLSKPKTRLSDKTQTKLI